MSTFETLESYSLYFRNLSEQGQSRFLSRHKKLSEEIEIKGVDILITKEIRDIIVSYFVQLTFGFENYFIGDYTIIHLYESSFVQRNNGDEREGKTMPRKIIALSWQSFSKSHLIPNDGENLGFYHLAQAMIHSYRNGISVDKNISSYYEKWGQIACEELLSKKPNEFFLTFKNEIYEGEFDYFFPLFIEWFFEKPTALKKLVPESYAHLCLLLNQDPLEITEDYKFSRTKHQKSAKQFPIPKKIKTLFTYTENNFLFNLPLISFIILPAIFVYYVRPNIILGDWEIFFISILLGFIIYFAGNKFFIGRNIFKTQFWFCINAFTGMAPILLFCIFLLAPYTSFNRVTSEHTVGNFQKVFKSRSGKSRRATNYLSHIIISFNDRFLDDYPSCRTFYPEDYDQLVVNEGSKATFETATTIWGFDVILHKEILIDQP